MLLKTGGIGVNQRVKKNKSRGIKLLNINKNLKKWLIISFSVILAVLLFLIYNTETGHKYTDREKPVYSYENKAGVNYEVFLLPNDIFLEKSLKEGNIYINKLIDYIDTTFRYEFIGEGPGEIKGKYSIKAMLEGYESGEGGDRIIWAKEYVLLPETDFSGNDKRFAIEEKLPIKPQVYSEYLKTLQNTLGFNCSNRLLIVCNISSEINTDKGVISQEFAPTMQIPVNSPYFAIGGELMQEKKDSIKENEKIISPSYNKKMTLYGILSVLCALSVLFLTVFTVSSIPDERLKRIRRIFKDHGDRMVAVDGEMEAIYERVIDVTSIEDLVRISDDVCRPILYKKSSDLREISDFYVIDGGNIYIFRIPNGLEIPVQAVEMNSLSM